ncbi:MFS transporter [Streptomyces iranensis]|uniref:MFS transporter n=1 Tax=Streptomyces iranensis TaxID=576784 RepID=UPI0039B74B49
MLLAGRVVSSLSHAAFLALAPVMATSMVPEHKTSSAIATVASGFTVATLLGVPMGSLLGHAVGWRAHDPQGPLFACFQGPPPTPTNKLGRARQIPGALGLERPCATSSAALISRRADLLPPRLNRLR